MNQIYPDWDEDMQEVQKDWDEKESWWITLGVFIIIIILFVPAFYRIIFLN